MLNVFASELVHTYIHDPINPILWHHGIFHKYEHSQEILTKHL